MSPGPHTLESPVFHHGGAVCGVHTLDFPEELDSSFWAAIFGGHETTQTANGDEENSDLRPHYSDHAAKDARWPSKY